MHIGRCHRKLHKTVTLNVLNDGLLRGCVLAASTACQPAVSIYIRLPHLPSNPRLMRQSCPVHRVLFGMFRRHKQGTFLYINIKLSTVLLFKTTRGTKHCWGKRYKKLNLTMLTSTPLRRTVQTIFMYS